MQSRDGIREGLIFCDQGNNVATYVSAPTKPEEVVSLNFEYELLASQFGREWWQLELDRQEYIDFRCRTCVRAVEEYYRTFMACGWDFTEGNVQEIEKRVSPIEIGLLSTSLQVETSKDHWHGGTNTNAEPSSLRTYRRLREENHYRKFDARMRPVKGSR